MTTLEIILSSLTGLVTIIFGGKYLWEWLITKSNNDFKLKKDRIEKDENDIRNLELKYSSLESKYRVLEIQNKQMTAALSIILPLLERLAQEDDSVKAALGVLKEMVLKDE